MQYRSTKYRSTKAKPPVHIRPGQARPAVATLPTGKGAQVIGQRTGKGPSPGVNDHGISSGELFKMLDDEDRLALQSLREQQLAALRVRRAQTPASVAKLSYMVAAWRAYAGSGIAGHKILTKLAEDYRCDNSKIHARLGHAVGLGLIEEAELPAWAGKAYRGNIEIHSRGRNPALVELIQAHVANNAPPSLYSRGTYCFAPEGSGDVTSGHHQA